MSEPIARCSYVPPHVLNMAARRAEDSQPARLSVQLSKAKRSRRKTTAVSLEQFRVSAQAAQDGEAARRVYDCQAREAQQVELVRAEGDEPTDDAAADLIYDYAGIVRRYFSEELGRNSIDNQGMDLVLNVHYGTKFMNAFWDGDEMTFGDGDGEIFAGFTDSLEVVAHELAHGVIQFTAGLNYRSQSGALNEHFADVFGAAVAQHHLGQDAGDADWLIGNEIMGPTLFGESLRSMQAPGCAYDNQLLEEDPQPAHMNDYFTGPEDHQGVHINSGIPNKAFYLVAMDIGTPAAARIWYRALQNLWASAVFNDAFEVLVEAARVLVKEDRAPAAATQSVRVAFREVGLPT